MAKENEKKIVLLYVLEILKKYSDEKHLLKYSDIIAYLKKDYGLDIERKAVGRNIDTLIEYGAEIEKRGNTGCYLSYRDFDRGELLFLIDAIYSSKSISSKYARELIDKLTNNCSIYDKEKICRVEKVDETASINNKQIFYNLEVLYEAIERKKKVKFQYNEYDILKGMTPRNNGKEYIINPYYLVNSRGKYYLVCNYDKYNNLSNYKIENISNVTILSEDIKPLNKVDDCSNFSIKKYINEHIYMTHGGSVKAVLKLNNTRVINDIIDWFGPNIKTYTRGEDVCVSLNVNEQALVYWALQYGSEVQVEAPSSTVDLIKQRIADLNNKYV